MSAALSPFRELVWGKVFGRVLSWPLGQWELTRWSPVTHASVHRIYSTHVWTYGCGTCVPVVWTIIDGRDRVVCVVTLRCTMRLTVEARPRAAPRQILGMHS